jgi:hypothetical protein
MNNFDKMKEFLIDRGINPETEINSKEFREHRKELEKVHDMFFHNLKNFTTKLLEIVHKDGKVNVLASTMILSFCLKEFGKFLEEMVEEDTLEKIEKFKNSQKTKTKH